MRSNLILKEMAKLEKSLVSVRYSSCLPYALGNNIVKYRLIAAEPVQDVEPGASPNYLVEDIKRRLQAGAISFLLEAQSFVDDSVTPIDRATERWEESHLDVRHGRAAGYSGAGHRRGQGRPPMARALYLIFAVADIAREQAAGFARRRAADFLSGFPRRFDAA